jgi:hypothetical protein
MNLEKFEFLNLNDCFIDWVFDLLIAGVLTCLGILDMIRCCFLRPLIKKGCLQPIFPENFLPSRAPIKHLKKPQNYNSTHFPHKIKRSLASKHYLNYHL